MDPEELTLEQMLNSAYSRGLTNFKDGKLAKRIAFDSIDEFRKGWENRLKDRSQKDGGSIPAVNPAYYFDQLITKRSKLYEDRFMQEHRLQKRKLSREDIWFWLTQDLLHYAKKRASPYMPAATLMVLAGFRSRTILDLYWFVARSKDPKDRSVFSTNKVKELRYLEKRFGDFIRIETVQKNAQRYEEDETSAPYFDMFERWLEQLTPLFPQCFLPETFKADTVETEYINNITSSYPDAVERNRKHIMQCPTCLTRLLRVTKYVEWSKTFRLPKITLPGPDAGDDGPKSGRAEPRTLNPNEVGLSLAKRLLGRRGMRRQAVNANIVSEAERIFARRDARRRRLDLNAVFVAVDNHKPRKIRPNEKLELNLEDGDGAICITGRDSRGHLPLDTHLISWSEESIDDPVSYATQLRRDRSLVIDLKYRPDMMGATAEVRYLPVPEWSFERAPLRLAFVKAAILLVACFGGTFALSKVIKPWSKSNVNSAAGVQDAASAGEQTREDSQTGIQPKAGATGNVTSSGSPNVGATAAARVEVEQRDTNSGRSFVRESRLRRAPRPPERNKVAIARWEAPDQRKQGRSRLSRWLSRLKKDAQSVIKPPLSAAKPILKRFGIAESKAPRSSGIDIDSPGAATGNQVIALTPSQTATKLRVSTGQSVTVHIPHPVLVTSAPPPATVTLTGIVTDLDDNPIPFAIITFRARRPGEKPFTEFSRAQIAVVCNGAGEFQVRYTTSDTYDVMVDSAGFLVTNQTGIKVSRDLASLPRIHIKLQPEKPRDEYGKARTSRDRQTRQYVDSF